MTDWVPVLRDRALARRAEYETIEFDVLPNRAQIGVRHIEGTASKVLLSPKKRFLQRGKLVSLGEDVRETPTTVARDYLKLRGFQAARLRGGTKDLLWGVMRQSPAFPQFAKPGRFDDAFYLDIRKCFFALMHIVGWNCAYAPGRFLIRGEPPDDFPFPDHAVARNSLVTCSTSREIYAIDPPSWNSIRLAHFNGLLNTSLNAFIRDVLHVLAGYALKAGACYAHTDGYIAENYQAARQIGAIIEDFGLAYAVKARGRTQVIGLGAYSVGPRVTKLVGRSSAAIQAVREVESAQWLQQRMESLAAMDGHLNLRSDAL